MENAGIGELSKSIVAWLPLALPLILVVMFGWVILRTESWHLLRRRTWQLVHGKGGITDPALQSYVEEQTNLTAFRVFVGVPVATMPEAHALEEWCRVQGVRLETLRFYGQYFDAKTRTIKKSWRYLTIKGRACGMATLGLAILVFVCWELMVVPYAALTVKESGQHFLASEAEIRTVLPLWNAPTLQTKDCVEENVVASRLAFSKSDVALLCDLLPQSEFKQFVRKAMHDQRGLLFVLGLGFFFAMCLAVLAAARCFSARSLLERKIPPWLPGEQMPLDFDAR